MLYRPEQNARDATPSTMSSAPTHSPNLLRDNIARVRERIAAAAARVNRHPGDVTLIGVSKTHPAEMIRAAYEAGLRNFGENRVQEWEGKRQALTDLVDANWHLIGHLQSNKATRAATIFHSVDSVDDLALAQRFDRHGRAPTRRTAACACCSKFTLPAKRRRAARNHRNSADSLKP